MILYEVLVRVILSLPAFILLYKRLFTYMDGDHKFERRKLIDLSKCKFKFLFSRHKYLADKKHHLRIGKFVPAGHRYVIDHDRKNSISMVHS